MARQKIRVVSRKLGRERAVGQAFKEDRVIEVDPRQPPRDLLDTLIHEALHVAQPAMSEREVARTSRVITGVLWKEQYRKISQ